MVLIIILKPTMVRGGLCMDKKMFSRSFFKKLLLMFMFLILLSPFVIYLLSNIKVRSSIYDYESLNYETLYDNNCMVIQTYKWDLGRYYISDLLVPNFNEYKFGKCKTSDGCKIVYIRRILGNNFDRQLSDNITIEDELYPLNTYTVNAYKVSGYLIPTSQRFNDSPVCDLYVEKWDIIKEIQRNGFYELFSPNYYLAIVDFRLFSNLFYDVIIIYIISLLLYKLFSVKLKLKLKNRHIKFVMLGLLSLILSTVALVSVAYLTIKLLY